MDIKPWRAPIIVLGVLMALFLITQLRENRYAVKSGGVLELVTSEVDRIVLIVGDNRAELVTLDDHWRTIFSS